MVQTYAPPIFSYCELGLLLTNTTHAKKNKVLVPKIQHEFARKYICT